MEGMILVSVQAFMTQTFCWNTNNLLLVPRLYLAVPLYITITFSDRLDSMPIEYIIPPNMNFLPTPLHQVLVNHGQLEGWIFSAIRK